MFDYLLKAHIKIVDTINLQNFENDLDISLKQKNIAGKNHEKG